MIDPRTARRNSLQHFRDLHGIITFRDNQTRYVRRGVDQKYRHAQVFWVIEEFLAEMWTMANYWTIATVVVRFSAGLMRIAPWKNEQAWSLKEIADTFSIYGLHHVSKGSNSMQLQKWRYSDDFEQYSTVFTALTSIDERRTVNLTYERFLFTSIHV